jgi:hypothetical protein
VFSLHLIGHQVPAEAFAGAGSRGVVPYSARTAKKQQDRETESRVFHICARAGVCCIGLAPDYVLFQPTVTSLTIPLAEFANPERAIELINAKLAEVQR